MKELKPCKPSYQYPSKQQRHHKVDNSPELTMQSTAAQQTSNCLNQSILQTLELYRRHAY